jgi:hypothetical protein
LALLWCQRTHHGHGMSMDDLETSHIYDIMKLRKQTKENVLQNRTF